LPYCGTDGLDDRVARQNVDRGLPSPEVLDEDVASIDHADDWIEVFFVQSWVFPLVCLCSATHGSKCKDPAGLVVVDLLALKEVVMTWKLEDLYISFSAFLVADSKESRRDKVLGKS
jgi:hypothetical protein